MVQPKSAVYHSEVEDSAETSSEEPDLTRLQGQEVGSIAQPKYIRFLDKVAQSKYFQQVMSQFLLYVSGIRQQHFAVKSNPLFTI